MKQLLLIGLFLLTSCEKNEFTVPAPAFPNGGGYSVPSRSAPQPAPMAPPATNQHPMIQDPEGNLEDIGIEVKAESEAHARTQCENQAKMRSDNYTIATCLGCKKRTKTTGKYMCTIRIETTR